MNIGKVTRTIHIEPMELPIPLRKERVPVIDPEVAPVRELVKEVERETVPVGAR